VGIDLSPEMLAIAGERVRRQSLAGVSLIEGAIERAELPEPFDAALFSLTHDVLQSPPALGQVFAQLRPGARVAAFGAKRGSWWPSPLVRVIGRRYVTTFEGLDRPWRLLERFVPDLRVEPLLFGGAYVAVGSV
jgi:SAM-dependent methyltransferase